MMTRAAFIFIFVIILSSCELLDPNPGPNPIDARSNGLVDNNTEVSFAVGERVYRASCERCHGAQAEGSSLFEFSIAGFTNTTNIVRNGLRSMPAFPHFTDQTIESIELFLAEQIVPNLVTGQDYFQFYCQRCHGADARGTDLGPNIRRDNANSYLRAIRNGPGTMPSYTETQISDDAVQLIVDYVSGL